MFFLCFNGVSSSEVQQPSTSVDVWVSAALKMSLFLSCFSSNDNIMIIIFTSYKPDVTCSVWDVWISCVGLKFAATMWLAHVWPCRPIRRTQTAFQWWAAIVMSMEGFQVIRITLCASWALTVSFTSVTETTTTTALRGGYAGWSCESHVQV